MHPKQGKSVAWTMFGNQRKKLQKLNQDFLEKYGIVREVRSNTRKEDFLRFQNTSLKVYTTFTMNSFFYLSHSFSKTKILCSIIW